jgi:hypothetical protein
VNEIGNKSSIVRGGGVSSLTNLRFFGERFKVQDSKFNIQNSDSGSLL